MTMMTHARANTRMIGVQRKVPQISVLVLFLWLPDEDWDKTNLHATNAVIQAHEASDIRWLNAPFSKQPDKLVVKLSISLTPGLSALSFFQVLAATFKADSSLALRGQLQVVTPEMASDPHVRSNLSTDMHWGMAHRFGLNR